MGLPIDNSNFYVPEFSPEEKAMRLCFVEEYLKDFDPVLACVRMGFHIEYAKQFSARFMEEPYTLKMIQDNRLKSEAVDDVERDKNLIIQTLREAMQHGPYVSRVAASKALADIRGLNNQPAGNDADLIGALKSFAQSVN